MSSTSKRYSPEVRDRAVRLVFEHQHEHVSQWSAIVSVAGKIGCTPETLRSWLRRVEVDGGRRAGVTSEERARLRELEYATLEWVDWFNHRRLFEAHGHIPPAEYEENHYRRNSSGQQAETQTKQPA